MPKNALVLLKIAQFVERWWLRFQTPTDPY